MSLCKSLDEGCIGTGVSPAKMVVEMCHNEVVDPGFQQKMKQGHGISSAGDRHNELSLADQAKLVHNLCRQRSE